MKKVLSVIVATISLSALIVGVSIAAVKAEKISGEAEFTQHCAVCHPGGGNTINSAKTLQKKDRDVNGIKNQADIIAKMRNPGPGMTQFDKKTIPDKEAKAIAEYIMKTFK
jgi:cytochrome c6